MARVELELDQNCFRPETGLEVLTKYKFQTSKLDCLPHQNSKANALQKLQTIWGNTKKHGQALVGAPGMLCSSRSTNTKANKQPATQHTTTYSQSVVVGKISVLHKHTGISALGLPSSSRIFCVLHHHCMGWLHCKTFVAGPVQIYVQTTACLPTYLVVVAVVQDCSGHFLEHASTGKQKVFVGTL